MKFMAFLLTGIFFCLITGMLICPVTGIAAPQEAGTYYQATGTLHVDGNPVGMEISLDGRVAGQVPDSGVLIIENISVGQHAVMATFPGYEPQEVWVDVPDGLPAEVRIDLTKQSVGFLDISSNPPNVQVYVDDVYKGITPAKIEVLAGTHMVLLRLAGYQDWSAETIVHGGETAVVTGTMTSVSTPPVSTPSGGPSFIITILFVIAGCMIAYVQTVRR
ncbi:MAG TPA: PEGA domain-containing protein [Methanospirillum sp.]|uniref:PEGA domain-containing protein n=1 Tax=Methanospirillum sp. TaxID=45200 RepID=UPI002C9231BB|nr:PEGA domain-containing protein [Methanospirillum sp.]HOJ96115.1 PEGA domain-containing protein [Methanospirillum sp.]